MLKKGRQKKRFEALLKEKTTLDAMWQSAYPLKSELDLKPCKGCRG
jgi:hypothetical protein